MIIIVAVLPCIGPIQLILVGRVQLEVAGLHVAHVSFPIVYEHVEQVNPSLGGFGPGWRERRLALVVDVAMGLGRTTLEQTRWTMQ